MRQEMTGFGDAVVSAGPYANNLHLAETFGIRKLESLGYLVVLFL